jgi:succinate dehydrogenase/fumarate reductase cytochrome b subunit
LQYRIDHVLQLLGREYYQTSFGEKYLLAAPIVLHATAGIAKRLLARTKIHPRPPPRPATHLLSTTAYTALVLFIPIHVLTHRTYPSDAAAPIFAVGPAELDFEYVKFGLTTWPVRSYVLYAGLVGCVLLHAAEGVRVLLRVRFPNASSRPTKRRKMITTAIITLGGAILSGVFVMSREPLMIFASLSRRYQAAFLQSFIYRI